MKDVFVDSIQILLRRHALEGPHAARSSRVLLPVINRDPLIQWRDTSTLILLLIEENGLMFLSNRFLGGLFMKIPFFLLTILMAVSASAAELPDLIQCFHNDYILYLQSRNPNVPNAPPYIGLGTTSIGLFSIAADMKVAENGLVVFSERTKEPVSVKTTATLNPKTKIAILFFGDLPDLPMNSAFNCKF